ncbi:hypothetical protein PI125_g24784 [Phytophthora idaei]|nr:hypothetical protein PI125_g24784 [Phytophthora idaei]
MIRLVISFPTPDVTSAMSSVKTDAALVSTSTSSATSSTLPASSRLAFTSGLGTRSGHC